MKIIVFGATGGTGQHTWRQALDQGHQVTVFVRSAEKINHTDTNLQVVQGDIFDAESVANAVTNHDAVIVSLGSWARSDSTTRSIGTKHILAGMAHHNVERIIVVSMVGIGKSWTQTPWFWRLLYKALFRNLLADHSAQEALVQASPFDWTIVRPAYMKDQPVIAEYTVSNTVKSRYINREKVAEFLVKQLVDTTYSRRAITITS